MDARTAPLDREGLKKEIKNELSEEAKRKDAMACGGCLLVFLIVAGLPTLWILSFFARTGFVEVPVLTPWLYEAAKPEREVLPLGGSTSESVLRNIGARSSLDLHTSLVTFTAKESELTTLAEHGVWAAPKGVLPFPIREAQIAVDQDLVEVFLIAPRPHREATVLARFKPIVKDDGKIAFDVFELRIGGLEVPNGLAQMLVPAYSKFITDAIEKQAATMGTLIGINAEPHQLGFVFLPKQQ